MSLPEAVQQTDAWDKSKASVGAAHGAKAPTDDENVRRGGEEGGRTTTGSKGVALRATETTDMTGGGGGGWCKGWEGLDGPRQG